MRASVFTAVLLLSSLSSADAKIVVWVKDGFLYGRTCYYSDGTIKKTTIMHDCTDEIDFRALLAQPPSPKPISKFKNAVQTGAYLMCFYEDGTYVMKDAKENCPGVH